jgi:hypothetical protein
MATHRRYARTEKAATVARALLTTTEQAAEESGIPQSTVRYWVQHPDFAELRAETHEEVGEQFWATIQIGIARVAELIPKTEDLQKVAVAVGILYDKHALLTGGATGRTESRDLSDLPDSAYIDAIHEARRLTSREGADPQPAEASEG